MIFKRGKFYWYEFEFRGRRNRATTRVLVGKALELKKAQRKRQSK